MSGYQQTDVSVPGASPVKLCWANLDATFQHAGDKLAVQISDSERERANRFYHAVDRDRFMASRYLLRQILGAYTGKVGSELDIQISPFGKPGLADVSIQFNLSHSGPYFTLAISRNASVGVDVESRLTPETAREVSHRILSDFEYRQWSMLSPNSMALCLTRYWTLKEAILKAYGEGFSQDPRQIELKLDGPVPEIIHLPEAFGSKEDWHLAEIAPVDTFPTISLALFF